MSVILALMLAAATPPALSKADAEAIQTMHRVGECLAAQHDKTARKVLALDFRTSGYKKALVELGRLGGLCARDDLQRTKLTSAGLPFAGSIAEALLKRDGIIADFAARTGYRAELPNIEARTAEEFMAFCTIRRDPAGTSALLNTLPASAEEAAAFQPLSPTLTACVPAKAKLEFSYESLRAMLALGAYRLAMHNAQPALATRERG